MSTTGKAAASKAAAAVAEAKGDEKTVEWQGLTLTMPAEIPAVLLFDITELEATSDGNPMPMFRLLRSLLGGQQFTQARHHVPKGDDGTAVFHLLSDALGQYGINLGESPASQDS